MHSLKQSSSRFLLRTKRRIVTLPGGNLADAILTKNQRLISAVIRYTNASPDMYSVVFLPKHIILNDIFFFKVNDTFPKHPDHIDKERLKTVSNWKRLEDTKCNVESWTES